MDLQLNNRVILVAAASKGLGFGIATCCAEQGAFVSLCSRSESAVTAAAAKIQEHTNRTCLGIAADVSEQQQIENWVSRSKTEFGRIDGLVVNAGGPPSGGFDDFDDADWQKAFSTTLLSSVRMIRAVVPELKKNGTGSILTITSSSIREPIPNLLLSNVFRSAVASLVKSLSMELGEHGIRVNNIVPGRIHTDRVDELDSLSAASAGKTLEEVRAARSAQIPLARYGETEEFGRAATFLLSPAASYINGATLLVDGGASRSIW